MQELEKLWNVNLCLLENNGVICTHKYEVCFTSNFKAIAYGNTLQQLYDNLQDKLQHEKDMLQGEHAVLKEVYE